MPIDEDEQDDGDVLDTMATRVLDFLEDNQPIAYSNEEIANQLISSSNDNTPSDVRKQMIDQISDATELLDTIGDLESIEKDGKVYHKAI
jgi:hypothetical protein